jgi:hypothetical protein
VRDLHLPSFGFDEKGVKPVRQRFACLVVARKGNGRRVILAI